MCFGLSVHRTSLLWFSLPPLGLFFRIEVQTPTVTLARPLFVTSVCLETHIKPHQFFFFFFFFFTIIMLVMGCAVSSPCNNLLFLPCGKLVVSLTRLEFLLHTYMAFSHAFKLFKVGFKPTAGLARHIHFACTDINQLFHTI